MGKYDYTYGGSEGYCYPGTDILINKLGISDERALTTAEREITSLKLLILFDKPAAKEYDFAVLSEIHKTIFGDLYDWAGQIRRGDFFSKGDSIFCRGRYIMESAGKIMGDLRNENFLKGLGKTKFIERTAFYMGEVNALHPFREGNGRTAREFFRQLSLSANYLLDFGKTDNEKLLIADIEAFNGRYDDLVKILEMAINEK